MKVDPRFHGDDTIILFIRMLLMYNSKMENNLRPIIKSPCLIGQGLFVRAISLVLSNPSPTNLYLAQRAERSLIANAQYKACEDQQNKGV